MAATRNRIPKYLRSTKRILPEKVNLDSVKAGCAVYTHPLRVCCASCGKDGLDDHSISLFTIVMCLYSAVKVGQWFY